MNRNELADDPRVTRVSADLAAVKSLTLEEASVIVGRAVIEYSDAVQRTIPSMLAFARAWRWPVRLAPAPWKANKHAYGR